MENYQIAGRIGEGAHGLVLDAYHIMSRRRVALKKISLKRLTQDGIPIKVLREIKSMQIVRLYTAFAHGAAVVLVMEYMHGDLKLIIERVSLSIGDVKSYARMMFAAVQHLHDNSIMHRDLKPSNLLIDKRGVLKVADMGQARLFHEDVTRPYSHQVCTRWYRAPELLYGSRNYDKAVDLWSTGCVLGEMLTGRPVFPGENDIDQLVCVFKTMGSPNENTWPQMSAMPDYGKIDFPPCEGTGLKNAFSSVPNNALNLLESLLLYDATKRLSATACSAHDFVTSVEPEPATPLNRLPRYMRPWQADSVRRPRAKRAN